MDGKGMEETERSDLMQRLTSSAGTSSSSVPRAASRSDLPMFAASSQSRGLHRGFPPAFSPEGGKRSGIPPLSPYSLQIPPPVATRSPSSGGGGAAAHSFSTHHSRSLSQPAFFSLDSLPHFPFPDTSPPVSLSSPASPADAPAEDRPPPPLLSRTNSGSSSCRASGDGLPPRKAHRRTQSDIPFGLLHSPLPLSAASQPSQGFGSASAVKQESEWDRDRDSSDGAGGRKSDADPGADDLFSAYMNLDSLDTLNSSDDRREDLDSRASGTKTNGADSSENEAESGSVNESGSSGQPRAYPGPSAEQGTKRRAAGDSIPTTSASTHCRSLSIDSFMGKLNFGDEPPMLPPAGQHSCSGSMDGSPNTFSLEFGNGEFSPVELKKIVANEKLAEIAVADPKRAKRILANRQSAARSKERKMRYISELEHKVQTLQTEATTLSAQLTMLQRDSAGLTSQDGELKFCLQAMEQQAQLRDALNGALIAEVQRLKLATAELGEAHLSNSLNQQIQMNPQMYQLQQLQKQQQ